MFLFAKDSGYDNLVCIPVEDNRDAYLVVEVSDVNRPLRWRLTRKPCPADDRLSDTRRKVFEKAGQIGFCGACRAADRSVIVSCSQRGVAGKDNVNRRLSFRHVPSRDLRRHADVFARVSGEG